jgi:hypothetical protein
MDAEVALGAEPERFFQPQPRIRSLTCNFPTSLNSYGKANALRISQLAKDHALGNAGDAGL